MKAKTIIELGCDDRGQFIQHYLDLDGTKTNIAKRYYEEVDKALIQNMPQDILEEMVEQGKAELYRREFTPDYKKLCPTCYHFGSDGTCDSCGYGYPTATDNNGLRPEEVEHCNIYVRDIKNEIN